MIFCQTEEDKPACHRISISPFLQLSPLREEQDEQEDVFCSLQGPIGMDQDLGISFNPLVELVVCHLSVLDTDLMADHKRWLRLTGNDQIPQVSVILLDIALARGQRQAL